MRIGARWPSGATPPATLPAALVEAIRAADADRASGSWTLTWLEERPVVEHDDGTRIGVTADGAVASGDEVLDTAAGVDGHATDDEADDEDDDLFPEG